MVNYARMLSTFLDLVKIKAESGAEQPVVQYILPCLRRLGLVIRQGSEERAENIVAVLPPTADRNRCIALSAHMDTVFLSKPVVPRICEGVITSSGDTILGADDRAGIAAILEGLETLIEKRIPHHCIEIIFTVKEETGLEGAKKLDLNQLQASMAFIIDNGADPGHIVVQAPSHVKIKWVISGRAAHAGASPENGVNAILAAAEGLRQIKSGRIDHETTANIGMIHGGGATNIVCDSVIVEGEARSNCEKKLEDTVSAMVEAMEKGSESLGAKVKTRVQKSYRSFTLTEMAPSVQWASSAVRRCGLIPVLISTGGGSDANILNEKGIEAVTLGTGAKNAHTSEEYILERDLYTLGDIVYAIMNGA